MSVRCRRNKTPYQQKQLCAQVTQVNDHYRHDHVNVRRSHSRGLAVAGIRSAACKPFVYCCDWCAHVPAARVGGLIFTCR